MARRRYRDFGDLPVGLDAFLPSAVGGGACMGTALLLRGLVSKYAKTETGAIKTDSEGKPIENWGFKYAGLIGAGVGILGSMVLAPFKGWGYAISGGLTSLFTGLTANLYDVVVPEEEQSATAGMGYLIARKAPMGQPFLGRGRSRLGYMVSSPSNPALPENVTAFPQDVLREINMKAFGGK